MRPAYPISASMPNRPIASTFGMLMSTAMMSGPSALTRLTTPRESELANASYPQRSATRTISSAEEASSSMASSRNVFIRIGSTTPSSRCRRDWVPGLRRGRLGLAVGPEFEVGAAHRLQHVANQKVDVGLAVVGHHLDPEARAALRH